MYVHARTTTPQGTQNRKSNRLIATYTNIVVRVSGAAITTIHGAEIERYTSLGNYLLVPDFGNRGKQPFGKRLVQNSEFLAVLSYSRCTRSRLRAFVIVVERIPRGSVSRGKITIRVEKETG